MKETFHTVVEIGYLENSSHILHRVEHEVKRYWDQGWILVDAAPDGLLESIRFSFEREIPDDMV